MASPSFASTFASNARADLVGRPETNAPSAGADGDNRPAAPGAGAPTHPGATRPARPRPGVPDRRRAREGRRR